MSCLILDPQMLARYFIFCVIALLMLLDCSRDETIFDNGRSAANDNCTVVCHSIFSCHWIVQVVRYRIGETMYGV